MVDLQRKTMEKSRLIGLSVLVVILVVLNILTYVNM